MHKDHTFPRISDATAIFISIGIAALASFRAIDDGDAAWHIAFGRVIAREGLQFRNALSWTAPDFHWYPTSWLYDRVAFACYDHFGPAGIQGLTLFLMILVVAGLAVAAQVANSTSGVWLLPAIILLEVPRLRPRSYIANWVVIAWTLAFCMRRSWKWRAAAIPIIAIGSNFHSGGVIASAVLGLFCLETAWRDGKFGREAAIAIAGVAALLANPGGWENLLSLRDHLHTNELLPIQEFHPATLDRNPIFFCLMALVAAFAWKLRREVPALLIAAGGLAIMALRHQRFVDEFTLLAGIILAAGIPWLARFGRGRVALFTGAVAVLGLAAALPRFGDVPMAARFDERHVPVRAARFIEAEHIKGRLFNAYTDGGYLSLATQQPVYVDARLMAYPSEFIADEIKSETSRATFLERMKSLGVEYAVTMSYGGLLSGYRAFDSPDWALVYWDDLNEVFLRRDIPRFADVVHKDEYRYVRPSSNTFAAVRSSIEKAQPADLAAIDRETERFARDSPQSLITQLARCLIAERTHPADADRLCHVPTDGM